MLSFTENLWFGTMKKMNISVVKCCYSNHKPRTVAPGNAWKAIAAQLTAAPLMHIYTYAYANAYLKIFVLT